MRATIESIGAVVRAEFDIEEGLTFLAGDNQTGKSTVLRAIGAVVAAETKPLSGYVKADAEMMVSNNPVYGPAQGGNPPEIIRRDGPKAGSVLLEGEGFRRRIEWFAAGRSDMTGTLESEMQVSAIAAGLKRFSLCSKDQRFAELSARLGMPGLEDIKNAAPAATEAMLAAIKAHIARGDWDHALKIAKQSHLELQRTWSSLSGASYRANAVADFNPVGLPADPAKRTAKYLTETLRPERDKLKQKLAQMVAPVPAESLAKWQELAKDKPDAEAAVAMAQERLEQMATLSDRLQAAHDAMPEPGQPEQTVLCPCCRKPVVIEGGALRKPRDGQSAEDLETARLAKAEANRLATLGRRDRAAAVEALRAANDRLKTATEHEMLLANLQPPSEGIELVKAQHDAIVLEGTALTAWLNAKKEGEAALAWGQLREQLEPDGLRAKHVKEQLAEVNKLLYSLAKPLGSYHVHVDEEMEITVGGRPWAPMSGSEKWLADVLIQCVLGYLEDAEWLLIDGVDVLTETRRARMLMKVLQRLSDGRRIVLSCAVEDLEAIPDLEARDLGRTYLVTGGTVLPFEQDARSMAYKSA